MGFGNHLTELAQSHFREKGAQIRFEHVVHFQQGQHRAIFVVGDEFAFLRQTHGIKRMGFKHANHQIRNDADGHQRHEQMISARELRDEENAGQRRMHHARH